MVKPQVGQHVSLYEAPNKVNGTITSAFTATRQPWPSLTKNIKDIKLTVALMGYLRHPSEWWTKKEEVRKQSWFRHKLDLKAETVPPTGSENGLCLVYPVYAPKPSYWSLKMKYTSMVHSFMSIRTIYTRKAPSGQAMSVFSMITERISSPCVPAVLRRKKTTTTKTQKSTDSLH